MYNNLVEKMKGKSSKNKKQKTEKKKKKKKKKIAKSLRKKRTPPNFLLKICSLNFKLFFFLFFFFNNLFCFKKSNTQFTFLLYLFF